MEFVKRFKESIDYNFYQFTQGWILLGALVLAALISWMAVFASAQNGQLEVHFFDVGQGDAIFIELPDGRQILIDGGPDDTVVEKLNEAMSFFDKEIDIVIATHNEADHIGGLPAALAHYKVGTIIWNGVKAETKIFEEFKNAMDSEGSEIITGRCCARFSLSSGAFFEILHPFNSGDGPSSKSAKQNNQSLVIRLVYGNDSFLFTGDIERGAEYEIVKQNFNLQSDVLKIPHHGSKTSSSELFLEEVRPKVAVIFAGRNNPYGHPHEAVLDRLAKYAIKVIGTYEKGDILLVSNGDSF